MNKKSHKFIIMLTILWSFLGSNLGYSQQTTDSLYITQNKGVNIYQINFENQNIGFIATFARTPFVIFTIIGTLVGCIFSGITEFIGNIFQGFDYGYPNTNVIWELGWNKVVSSWWWKPSIWWHLAISIMFWLGVIGSRKN